MSKTSVTDHLAAVPLFNACSKKELGRIAKATTEMSFPDGTVLMNQDDTAREAFILTEGTALVKRNNRKVAELGPGAFLGELGLLDRGPRTATVVAQGPVEALVLGPREFAGLLDEVPTLSHKLLRALAARIRELDTKAYG
jgi:CRP/FNR family transcriptional regulator, cyclic AMP receptor protein